MTFSKFLRFIFILIASTLLMACAGRPPSINIPPSPPPPAPLKKQPRIALVLGSGGARGYAHLGILQVLKQAGVPIDLIVGASAGSYFGALYADSKSFKKTYDTMMQASFWDLADLGNHPSLQGVVVGYRMEKYLLHHMRARQFRQLPIKFVTATTDLVTGNVYMIQSGPIVPAVLASAAVPGVVRPVKLYGRTLIDGGVTDPVPVDLAKRFHPKIILAVNIEEILPKKLPSFSLSLFIRANSIIWQRLTEYSLYGANVVIRPNVGEVGTFDMSQRYRMYRAGYIAAKKALPKIKRLMRQHHILPLPISARKAST